MDNLDIIFKHPSIIQLSGPSFCEKSWLVLRILVSQLVQLWLSCKFLVFNELQPDYDQPRDMFLHIKFFSSWRDDH